MALSKGTPRKARIGVQLSAVIALLGERMYSSDVVFVRENVQNAVDASRMLARKKNLSPEKSEIRVTLTPNLIEIEDWGIGMSYEDLINFYWNVGASSKNTPEARESGCIGQFGIGGFANFGICSSVHVYTCTDDLGKGEIYSSVNKEDLQKNIDDL